MKKAVRILQKGAVWAGTLAVLLVGASSYTLLDAFVLPETYQVIVPAGQTVRTRSSATLGDFFGDPTGIPWPPEPAETGGSSPIEATSGWVDPENGETVSTEVNPDPGEEYDTPTEYQGEYEETESLGSSATGESGTVTGSTNFGYSTSRYGSTTKGSTTKTTASSGNKTTGNSGTTGTIGTTRTTPTTTTTAPTTTTTKATQPAYPIITDNYYRDAHMVITIQTVRRDNATCHIAEVWLADATYLQTAFAKNTFGKNIKEYTSVMAKNNGAIFAISGDYYGFRDTGIIIRNGMLYRDVPRSAPDNKTLTIDYNGNMAIVTDGSISGADMVKNGVWQSWSFGPPLVQNGQATKIETNVSKSVNNSRMAIGQLGPLHYLIVAVDGRLEDSPGMTFPQLQQIFLERGAITAYNLDGGGTATMWFNGKLVNTPTDGKKIGERHISDIIFF